ncbi:MAG: hypothetical protein RMY63_11585 [Nostoc sp. ChiQUE01b]|nr:hypothetical protein [Nostoc sp. ChiQUE01b]
MVQSNFGSIPFSTQNSGSTQDCTELPMPGGDGLSALSGGDSSSARWKRSH